MEQTSDRPRLYVRCDPGETFGAAHSAVEEAGREVFTRFTNLALS
jgi:hypothetical protein